MEFGILTPGYATMRIPKEAQNMIKQIYAMAIALGIFGAMNLASANLIIAINQTGANDPVNIDSPRVWNFGVTSVGAAYFSANGITFDSALFDAKTHNDTTAPLVFTIYSGLGGNVAGNTALSSITMPASQFNQQYAGGAGRLFTFNALALTTGYYSVTLTSTAADKATEDYFLKQGKLALLNSDGTAMNSSYWLQDQGTGNATATFTGSGSLYPSALAPEVNPAWAMAILGLVSFGKMALRRQRKTVPAAA